MKGQSLATELQGRIKGRVLPEEPLARHTTFRIGGPAEFLALPADRTDLEICLTFARQKGLPLYVMGNGSNLLVRDEGVRGLVIKMAGLGRVEVRDRTVWAEGGAPLPLVLAEARRARLTGLEFAAGIPASVGGAVVMNAGTPEGSIGRLVEKVEVLDRDGKALTLGGDELDFKYRESKLKGAGLVVVAAALSLNAGDEKEIVEAIARNLALRRRKQPLNWPNAGSIFKNPPGHYAGWLIEQVGAKGWRQGDAEVSSVHANFIVNRGRATASDVLHLVARIQQAVADKFGIFLETEIEVWGEGP
ncbi:UDP-N-acetylmuramate dehydrogenase [Thermanaeromonas sp. C210]|uniref:UDP-N-acetylmuramate dehydrogenase n=1 Tax=Thermanaeromonas sp. C210 TaxID=2731925 RepID=UPI00155C7328|nr:UDP-N-acetylmuramate dehydrogenase [Thermanaeromonas sp. C210]GFN24074.1 UDP-N-acetylenolpyruvoylglucosamine reductase [Thermanaeromonas sp. C210]